MTKKVYIAVNLIILILAGVLLKYSDVFLIKGYDLAIHGIPIVRALLVIFMMAIVINVSNTLYKNK